MISKLSCALLFVGACSAQFVATQAEGCPDIHVFGARETTARPGFGTAQDVVQSIQQTNPGATREAIEYPAAGGQNYSSSVRAGVRAVVDQLTNFTITCPSTQLVLIGYSQVSFHFLATLHLTLLCNRCISIVDAQAE